MKFILFLHFSFIIATVYSAENDYTIDTGIAAGCNVTLNCKFSNPVYCKWSRDSKPIRPNHRYSYKHGDGDFTTDCSLQLRNLRKMDFEKWLCEGYDTPERSNNATVATAFRLSEGHGTKSEGMCVPEYQNAIYLPSRGQSSTSRKDNSCNFNTYVDLCYYMMGESMDSIYLLHHFDHERHTDQCSSSKSDLGGFETICGGVKELRPITNIDETTIALTCNDIIRSTNCSWRHNHKEVTIDGFHYRYLINEGINTNDCSIHIQHTSEADEGIWECRMTNESAINFTTSILNVYEVILSKNALEARSTISHDEIEAGLQRSILYILIIIMLILIARCIVAIAFFLTRESNKRRRPFFKKIQFSNQDTESTADIQFAVESNN